MHYWRLTNFIVYLWLTIEYDLCQILQVGLITDTKKKSWENTKDQIELCHDLGTDTKEKSWENTKDQIILCRDLLQTLRENPERIWKVRLSCVLV
jgi:hypothetical protein